MPNASIHIGLNYLIYKITNSRYIDLRLFILGAILPDISRIEVFISDVFHVFPNANIIGCFSCWHTPFLMALLAVSISLLTDKFILSFFSIFLGTLLHLSLDILEISAIGGVMLFYPFSFKQFALNLVEYDSTSVIIITTVFIIFMIYSVFKKSVNVVHFKTKNLYAAFFIAIISLSFPLLTAKSMVDQNIEYLNFSRYPDKWQNKEVGLNFSEVISGNPLTIIERGVKIEVVTDEKFKKGDFISVKGIYENGKIHPDKLYKHRGLLKLWLSFPALILIIILWIKGTKVKGSMFKSSKS